MAMKKVEFSISREIMQEKELEQLEALRKEIQILRGLEHKHIVRYYDMIENSDSVSLFMEFMKGGSIYNLISKQGALSEKDVSKYCQQILEGMEYLHKNGIVHRDLKCANILLDDHNNCKLADFGISKHAENIRSMSGCNTFCGTPYWISPEIILGQKYGWKTDIWSFGCTVLEMLNGKPPYREMERRAAMFKIGMEELNPSFPPHTSDHCKEFIEHCLRREPECRPSAKDLLGYKFTSVFNES